MDAARVEGAVLLDQRERIAGPVLALRLDHVDVSQQQNGLEFGVPPRIEGHQAAFLRMIGRREQVQVGVGESGRLQARRHTLCSESAAAVRQRGIGFDELLVQGAKFRLAGGGLRAGVVAGAEQGSRGRGGQSFMHVHPEGSMIGPVW
jgi:hypothetical protein